MRVLLLLVIFLAICCSPTLAGKNAGGALIVHSCAQASCTLFQDYCVEGYVDPGSCEDAVTEFPSSNCTFGCVFWILASFHETADPGVTGVYFGLDHNLPFSFGGGEYCGPPGTYEAFDDGWPVESGTGDYIDFGESIAGNRLFPVYVFSIAEAYEDSYLRTDIHPVLGYAAFVSDDEPEVLDEIRNFGQINWTVPGWNECPDPQGACCREDDSCEILTQASCMEGGGLIWIYDMVCDPNPCGTAAVDDGDHFRNGSWGGIKTQYR